MYIISNDRKFGQIIGIILCVIILFVFFYFFLVDKNIYTFSIFLIGIALLIYTNINNSKQFDVRIENGFFIISNLYKRPKILNAELFNNVTAVERIFPPIKAYRYSINFKDGSSYIFIKRDENLKEVFKSQNKIADELSKQISDYLSLNLSRNKL